METNDELVERPNTGNQPPNSVGPLNEPVDGHKLISVAASAAQGAAHTPALSEPGLARPALSEPVVPKGSDPPGRSVGERENPGSESAAHTLQPGEVCPACERKVPHPRKSDSPTSKTRAYKVPVDELPAHDAVLDAAADHIGAAGKPFWQFKTVTAALACLLQDEGAKGLHG